MVNVQGQDRAVSVLQRALSSGRLASTWIFAGPAGVGKLLLAKELAKTVLCDSPRREKNAGRVRNLPDHFELRLPCGGCESCRAADAGNHPDLHVISRELVRMHDKSGTSKANVLSIDVIRGEITGDPAAAKESKIGKKSFRGRGKFFLIDEADYMIHQAQNALLKTLEEPPPESYLVLITASPAELLSTIRSRSQIVLFNELPAEFIAQRLQERGLNADDARLMARLARGSLGRALRWEEDMRVIDEKNGRAADRAAKARARKGEPEAAAGDAEDVDTERFTPGGILGWTRDLARALDDLAAGRAAGMDVAAVLASYAAEFAGLAIARDKFASADRAKRDGIGLLLAIAAEWFADRMRHGLGVPHETPLPASTGALDYGIVPDLIKTARQAEAQVDMNVNDKILLSATAIQWEQALRRPA